MAQLGIKATKNVTMRVERCSAIYTQPFSRHTFPIQRERETATREPETGEYTPALLRAGKAFSQKQAGCLPV